MKRQSSENSSSPVIGIIKSDYGQPNYYPHQRTSSTLFTPIGISNSSTDIPSVAISNNRSSQYSVGERFFVRKTHTKETPFLPFQRRALWKHPDHEWLEAKYQAQMDLDSLAQKRKKMIRKQLMTKRLNELKPSHDFENSFLTNQYYKYSTVQNFDTYPQETENLSFKARRTLWKHPHHEWLEAKYYAEMDLDNLAQSRLKKPKPPHDFENPYLTNPYCETVQNFDTYPQEPNNFSFKTDEENDTSLDFIKSESSYSNRCFENSGLEEVEKRMLYLDNPLLCFEKDPDDAKTDAPNNNFQSHGIVQTIMKKTVKDYRNKQRQNTITKPQPDQHDQESSGAIEDLPPYGDSRTNIKTKLPPRLSTVKFSNKPAKMEDDFITCRTPVPQKPMKSMRPRISQTAFSRLYGFHPSKVRFQRYLPDLDDQNNVDNPYFANHSSQCCFCTRRMTLAPKVCKSKHQTRSPLEKYLLEGTATQTGEDTLLLEEVKEDKELLVLSDINFLPRYKYHRSLLDWLIRGLPQDPAFLECRFIDCSIIVGGNLGDEKEKELFGEAAVPKNPDFLNLQEDTTARTDVLIVYFQTEDVAHMYQEITMLRNHHIFDKGTILMVMTTDLIDAERLKIMIEEKMATLGITSVEFVIEVRSEIINKITCILEQRLTEYLIQTKTKLVEYSSPTSNVRQSLFEVNAILRKLKQAARYPKPLEEDETGEKSDEKEIDKILQRFKDNILYHGYEGDELYVITNNQSVKENLEAWFHESGIENLQLVITFEDKLSTTELSKTGEPLNGAKFVYVHNSVTDFKEDKCFATIGGLMLASNDMLVAVTCQHAVEKKKNFYTLINNSVVKLGQELPQLNKQMTRLYDDIALIVIDCETRKDIDENCEKLLIDSYGVPSPAEISSEGLKKGDIVHKWGATTGITTGVVKEVKHQAIGRFTSESTVIFITGRDSEPFANEGDSGSLIFKHSESPEQNLLYIHAMVQSRLKVPFANAPIICFPFKESYDSLKNNLPDIQTLQFCKV